MIKILFKIFFSTFILILFIDFFFGQLIILKLDRYFSSTEFYERLIRINHPYYHHTLKPNIEYKKARGFEGNYTLCTDNHGFKTRCNNRLREKNFDYAFIGDSFVEVSLDYDDTFVGIFEKEKKLSVANLGVVSYSTSIYLSKVKFLLENNFKFKNLVVVVDVSDLYDDNTFYILNPDFSVTQKNAKKKNLKIREFLRENFPLSNYYFYVIKRIKRLNQEISSVHSDKPIFLDKNILKASWTYQKNDYIPGYLDPISKTKSEMLENMNKLYELLNKNNIKLSVVVYPWPQQLEYDDVNSEHVKMWEKFCINKCENFVNLFPFFFDEKNKTSYLDVYKKYYNWNDTHFNKLANKVIANKLIYTLK